METGRQLAEAGLVSSMIDVSDGIVQDLGHVCRASGTGAVISEEDVPRSPAYERVIGGDTGLSLYGGEDYELLFTVPRKSLASFERRARRLPDPVHLVGEIVKGRGVRLRARDGRLRRPLGGGFEHFKLA
jgi:thiamine-monophosphate kinase